MQSDTFCFSKLSSRKFLSGGLFVIDQQVSTKKFFVPSFIIVIVMWLFLLVTCFFVLCLTFHRWHWALFLLPSFLLIFVIFFRWICKFSWYVLHFSKYVILIVERGFFGRRSNSLQYLQFRPFSIFVDILSYLMAPFLLRIGSPFFFVSYWCKRF